MGDSIKCLLVTRGVPAGRRRIGDGVRQPARFANGAVAVLAPFLDSESGRELRLARARSRSRMPVWRLPLRTLPARPASRVRALWRLCSQDLPLMLRVFARVSRIVRRERIAVVVIGEVVYGGWLVAPCRFLLRRKVVLYIHGEELTMDHRPFIIAQARRGVHLRLAHAIVTVSRFGQQALIDRYRIPPTRSN